MKTPLPPLLGTSAAVRRALELVDRYAPTTLSILVVGPTGTGKELVARHIHARSGRTGPFVPVNCAALPRDMAESLMFGHRRGAFSGAAETRRGHVERANGGTLFLDEILCLPAEGQAKLLRALDTGEIQPLGEENEHLVDLRVVAAAPDAVWAERESGTFRPDVYQRVAGILIVLPPLAQRPEDIVPIARYFTKVGGRSLEGDAASELERHAWPGNVRELRQVIERAGRLVQNGTLSSAAVAEAIALGTPPGDGTGVRRRPTLFATTREELLATCVAHDWQSGPVAEAYAVGRTTLFKRLREVGLAFRRPKSGRSRVHLRTERELNG